MICIHNYLRKCETGSMPPGFIDFLRGTVALFNYSKKYNYNFYINKSIHPLFKYFKDSPYYISINTKTNEKTFELLSQANPDFVDHIIEKLFQNGNTIYIITNCLLESKHDITDESKTFIKTLLEPSDFLSQKLHDVYTKLGLNNDESYQCIHIRFGDTFLNQNNIDENILNIINPVIKNIIESENKPIILVSDCSSMANIIKNTHKNILYWDNQKIHLGNLGNIEDNSSCILDTLVDVLILSKSKKIFTFNISKQYKTTFSPFIAKIYNIENILFQIV